MPDSSSISSDAPQRTVLITGALGHTGRKLCRRFKNLGYFVVATDQKQGVCPCHFFVHVDLARLVLKEPPELFSQVVGRAIGGRSLDLLILNAAIDEERRFEDISTDSMEKTLRCNVVAPTVLVTHLQERLISAKGTILFTTSAYRQSHLTGRAEYAASKYALAGLVASLGEEFAERIRVYGIGAATTSLHDKRDRPDEFGERIADASVRAVEDDHFMPSGSVIYL